MILKCDDSLRERQKDLFCYSQLEPYLKDEVQARQHLNAEYGSTLFYEIHLHRSHFSF